MCIELRFKHLLILWCSNDPCTMRYYRYMLASTQHENEEIALEACEFWLSIAETEEAHTKKLLVSFLPRCVRLRWSCFCMKINIPFQEKRSSLDEVFTLCIIHYVHKSNK